MKTIIFLVAIIAIFISYIGCAERDNPINFIYCDNSYNFSAPEEWNNLETDTERFNALQIPTDLLEVMSTECLIITSINHPLAVMYSSAFNNVVYGINILVENFNGLQELLIRKDAPSKMLSIYSHLTVPEPNIECSEPELWVFTLRYFEYLLARNEIIDNLDENEKKKLVKEAHQKILDKVNNENFSNINSCLFIIAKVFDKTNYADFQQLKHENAEIEQFLNTGILVDNSSDSYLTTILTKMAYNFSKL